MKYRLMEAGCVVVFLALLLGGLRNRPTFDRLRDEPAKWSVGQRKLERAHGAMRFLGRVHVAYGGLDVYEQADGARWWVVGHDGRFEPSEPGPAVMAVADQMLARNDAEYRLWLEAGDPSRPLSDFHLSLDAIPWRDGP